MLAYLPYLSADFTDALQVFNGRIQGIYFSRDYNLYHTKFEKRVLNFCGSQCDIFYTTFRPCTTVIYALFYLSHLPCLQEQSVCMFS